MEISQLVDQLLSDNVNQKLNSIKNLDKISKAIGNQKTQKELIPFLIEMLDDQNDIVLELLKNINKIIDINQEYKLILPIIQKSCDIFDENINQQAVLLLKQISDIDSEAIIPIIQQFKNSEQYMKKIICCKLIPYINNQSLNKIFQELCENQDLKVRQQCGENLIQKDFFQTNNQQFLKKLIQDKENIVKISCIPSICRLGQIDIESFQQILLKLFQQPQIRLNLLFNLEELLMCMNKDFISNDFLQFYIESVDSDLPAVKIISVQQLEKVCKYLSKDEIIEIIIPKIKQLEDSELVGIKLALSEQIMILPNLIGKRPTTELLISTFLSLLKDEQIEVRLQLLTSMSNFVQVLLNYQKVIGTDKLQQSLIPAIIELSQHRNWRTRAALIEILPKLAEIMVHFILSQGNQFFNAKINNCILYWLQDRIFSVKLKILNILPQLAKILGEEWFQTNIQQNILELQASGHYKDRIMACKCVEKLAQFLNQQFVDNIYLDLHQDKVSNVRFSVLQCMNKDNDKYKKYIHKFKNDPNQDIKEYVMSYLNK